MTVSSDPFDLLGLDAKTATEADVKRAYAAKLKVTRPDDDPEGFMALRAALEQARNRVRWRDEYGDEDDDSEDGEDWDDDEADDGVYDEFLRSWVTGSPNGLIIQRASKWMQDASGEDADAAAFWAGLMDDPALAGVDEFAGFANCVRCGVAAASGYYGAVEGAEATRPDWLSDELIVLFHQRFGWHGAKETEPYAANLNNWIADLFEPVLQDKGLIAAPLERTDVRALEIAEIEADRADDHGSYFDKDADEWIDMSPPAVAMRKIEALTKSPWAATSTAPWDAVIEDPDLQTVDEFQLFSGRLRWFLCDASGIDEGEDSDPPTPPDWMTPSLLKHLDMEFGWSQQPGSEGWERRQNVWIGKVREHLKKAAEHNAARAKMASRLQSRDEADEPSAISLPMAVALLIFGIIFLYLAWMLVDGISQPPGGA